MTDPNSASPFDATNVERAGIGPLGETLAATVSSSPARMAGAKPQVPGYELVRVLGRGGMGIVWEAIEHRFDRKVALKVHIDEISPGRAAQIWSEARLAAKVADPGVVAVHDLGTTLNGSPYYTMDLVLGTDLRALLREGPLPQARALAIGTQVARAVAAAHERGIVHRDLKPSNILIDEQGRPRILDFGLAFGSAFGKDLFENLVFGTPMYMAPEQVSAQTVGAAADIHAIGILLYEMLTGERPFSGADAQETMHAVLELTPAPPAAKNPSIHADVERVILRCLEKKPEDRFPSARALAAALDALVEGRPLEASLRPPAPKRSFAPAPLTPHHARDQAPVHHVWSWRLASSPAELWPLVANTDRLNKAVGLPEVEFTDLPDGDGGSLRKGYVRMLGMDIVWREHPFEWCKERMHSVFRQYERGPLEALWNRVELSPAEGGGTDLVHEIWLVPRNLVGRVAASWEVGQKTGRALDRLYRQLDERLRHGPATPEVDPFEAAHTPTPDQRRHIENATQELAQRGFEQALLAPLSSHLLHAPTKVLECMRPYALADAWGMDRAQTLTLFLHAANVGLVDLAWDLICPRCMTAHESFTGLARVGRSGQCVPCNASYERDLRDSVELVFRPHPEARNATLTTYCAGAPALRPHVFAQQLLAPGEHRSVTVTLPRGDYRIAASHGPHPFSFTASAAGFLADADVAVENEVIDARPGVVRAGKVTFSITNDTAHEQIVRIEVPGARRDGVTAADVMTFPEFQDLFATEVLADGEHMSVSRMAFLCVELADRPGLLGRLGDAGVWGLLRKLEAVLDEQLRVHHGALVPASLDTHVAAFNVAASAVRAAIAVQHGCGELGEPLRVAVHEGRCIALTRTARTEYFGKTLHRALALLTEAPPTGVALSMAVAGERTVAEILQQAGVIQEVVATTGGAYGGTRIMRVTLSSSSPPNAG